MLVSRYTNCALALVVITINGIPLEIQLETSFSEAPQLIGIWGLFAFGSIEAKLIAPHNRRTPSFAHGALTIGTLTSEARVRSGR